MAPVSTLAEYATIKIPDTECGADEEVEQIINWRRVMAASLMLLAAGLAGASASANSAAPLAMVDPLVRDDPHTCPVWVHFCMDRPACLQRYHNGDRNLVVPPEKAASYAEDCAAYCIECRCPGDNYCDQLRDAIVGGAEGMNFPVPEWSHHTNTTDLATTGNCAWTGAGVYTQANKLYPACPDSYTLYDLDRGGYCCNTGPDGVGCDAGQEGQGLNGIDDLLCSAWANPVEDMHVPKCLYYDTTKYCAIAYGQAVWTNVDFSMYMNYDGAFAGPFINMHDPANEDSDRLWLRFGEDFGLYRISATDLPGYQAVPGAGVGACRTTSASEAGVEGTDFTTSNLDEVACRQACRQDATCLAVEVQPGYNHCQQWTTLPGFVSEIATDFTCLQKTSQAGACAASVLQHCPRQPCIDLKEGNTHHHIMALTGAGTATVAYYSGIDYLTPDGRTWTCTSTDYSHRLSGTWSCPGLYDGTITVSADWAADYTAQITTDSIDICFSPPAMHALAGVIAGPQPIARWTFDTDRTDSIGTMDFEDVFGSSTIDHTLGALVLDGNTVLHTNGEAENGPITLTRKTLSAFVSVDSLDSPAGASPMSVETVSPHAFDAIVFEERQANTWMAGSDYFERTQDLNGANLRETNSGVEVHIAIVYGGGGVANQIEIFHNGRSQGAYTHGTAHTFDANAWGVTIGVRHKSGSDWGALSKFTGKIYDMALYDDALTAEQITEVYESHHESQANPYPPGQTYHVRMRTQQSAALWAQTHTGGMCNYAAGEWQDEFGALKVVAQDACTLTIESPVLTTLTVVGTNITGTVEGNALWGQLAESATDGWGITWSNGSSWRLSSGTSQRIQAWVDGEQVADVSDSTLPSGAVGFATYHASMQVFGVKIHDLMNHPKYGVMTGTISPANANLRLYINGELYADDVPDNTLQRVRMLEDYQSLAVELTSLPRSSVVPADTLIDFTANTNVDVSTPGTIITTTGSWSTGTHSASAMQEVHNGLEFNVMDGTSHIMFGLSHGDSTDSWTDVDFGICLRGEWAARAIDIYEAGSYRGRFGTYEVGDHFAQVIDAANGNVVKYYKNNVLFYTSPDSVTFPIGVDASFYTPSHLENIAYFTQSDTAAGAADPCRCIAAPSSCTDGPFTYFSWNAGEFRNWCFTQGDCGEISQTSGAGYCEGTVWAYESQGAFLATNGPNPNNAVPGWRLSEMGGSCTQACGLAGLHCQINEFHMNLDQVDTSEETLDMLASLGADVGTESGTRHSSGCNRPADQMLGRPSWPEVNTRNGACYRVDSERTIDQVSCDAKAGYIPGRQSQSIRRGRRYKRLCYCSGWDSELQEMFAATITSTSPPSLSGSHDRSDIDVVTRSGVAYSQTSATNDCAAGAAGTTWDYAEKAGGMNRVTCSRWCTHNGESCVGYSTGILADNSNVDSCRIYLRDGAEVTHLPTVPAHTCRADDDSGTVLGPGGTAGPNAWADSAGNVYEACYDTVSTTGNDMPRNGYYCNYDGHPICPPQYPQTFTDGGTASGETVVAGSGTDFNCYSKDPEPTSGVWKCGTTETPDAAGNHWYANNYTEPAEWSVAEPADRQEETGLLSGHGGGQYITVRTTEQDPASPHHYTGSLYCRYTKWEAPSAVDTSELIVGGSFEEPLATSWQQAYSYSDASLMPPGWTISAGNVDWGAYITSGHCEGTCAHDGEQQIDLCGSSQGAIEQTVTTTADTVYTLTFAYNAHGSCGEATKTTEVFVDGTLLATVDKARCNGWAGYTSCWSTVSYTVTAATDSTTIKFKAVDNSCGCMTLDSVSFSAATTASSSTL